MSSSSLSRAIALVATPRLNNVSAQIGKSIAASTASQLIGEAQYLMASCS